MRRLFIILIFYWIISAPTNSFCVTDQRVALVIGNNNYIDAPLRNPVNDATDMANAVKVLDFMVTLKTDANQRGNEGSHKVIWQGTSTWWGRSILFRRTRYTIPRA